MRGEWKCRDWELDYWGRKLKADIAFIYNHCDSTDETLDYTKCDITPGQIGQVLEFLGWEFNDLERDKDYRYETYYNEEYEGYHLIVSACIDDFQLKIYFVEED